LSCGDGFAVAILTEKRVEGQGVFTPLVRNPAKPESKTSPGNPNLKARNPKQKRRKVRKKTGRTSEIETISAFGFLHCFEFRVSDFEFKYSCAFCAGFHG
jgi:hypothetical protein